MMILNIFQVLFIKARFSRRNPRNYAIADEANTRCLKDNNLINKAETDVKWKTYRSMHIVYSMEEDISTIYIYRVTG